MPQLLVNSNPVISEEGLSSLDSILADLPPRVPRDEAARLVTRNFFKISRRTLERWPVRWQRLNNKAHVDTRELFACAAAQLAASPRTMGGRCRSTEQNAA